MAKIRHTLGKHRRSPATALWIALAVSAALLAAGIFSNPGMDAQLLGRRLVLPLARLLFFIAVGLLAGQVIEASGWTEKLGRIGRPLFRFARLGPRCSAAFTTAFFSGAAANGMLYNFWQEGIINRRQLFLTNLANQLPAYFLHLPTTVFIVLPLTGMAGAIYFLLTFLAALLRFGLIVLFGHLRSAIDPAELGGTLKPARRTPGWSAVWETVRQKLPRRIMNVATYVVPIYVAVFLLHSAGAFEWTRQWMARWVTSAFIPIEALSLVVLSFAAEFTSGFAAAGALLKEGVLTTQQGVLALIIGNVVAFPIRALRHQLPHLLGIFTPKTGLQLLLMGQGFRIVSLLLVAGIYYSLF